jgi:hypothetical protein
LKKDYTLVKLGPYGRATHAIRKGETRAVCTLSSAKWSAQNETITARLGKGQPTCAHCLRRI